MAHRARLDSRGAASAVAALPQALQRSPTGGTHSSPSWCCVCWRFAPRCWWSTAGCTCCIKTTAADPVCWQLMTIPGIGPVAARKFRTGVDDPQRFERPHNVAAHFGMTPRRFQSGEVDYNGRISKCGDREVRQALYDAAGSLLRRCRKSCGLRTWGLGIMKRSGIKKATAAVSRKLAVTMYRMWRDGTEFRWSRDSAVGGVGVG